MAGRLFAIGVVVGALALAGCDDATDDTTSSSRTSSTQPTSTSAQTSTTTTAHKPDASQTQLYFTAGEQFKKLPADVPDGDPQEQVEAATQALIDGPPPGGHTATQLPPDTEVENVEVSGDGTATVRLSEEFLAGISAAAADRDDAQRQEIAARLGQLTYTLTQFDGVRSVDVVAGGEPVERDVAPADFAKSAQGPDFKAPPAGQKSAATKQLQERLADLEYLPRSAVDGEDGYRTQQAVMAFQAWEGLDRDGVAGPITQAALRKAKAPKPGKGGPSRRIEVYRDKGVALLIAHDRVKRAIHVSSGAPGTSTPAGTFEVYRKENPSWSVPFQVWLPYASYFTGGIAFHEYPDVPPYPASHGCVRVGSPEAPGVYRFAKLGTAVIVL
jgi:lipoprotein-anchoring transpeptidase ErfK/SrfK